MVLVTQEIPETLAVALALAAVAVAVAVQGKILAAILVRVEKAVEAAEETAVILLYLPPPELKEHILKTQTPEVRDSLALTETRVQQAIPARHPLQSLELSPAVPEVTVVVVEVGGPEVAVAEHPQRHAELLLAVLVVVTVAALVALVIRVKAVAVAVAVALDTPNLVPPGL